MLTLISYVFDYWALTKTVNSSGILWPIDPVQYFICHFWSVSFKPPKIWYKFTNNIFSNNSEHSSYTIRCHAAWIFPYVVIISSKFKHLAGSLIINESCSLFSVSRHYARRSRVPILLCCHRATSAANSTGNHFQCWQHSRLNPKVACAHSCQLCHWLLLGSPVHRLRFLPNVGQTHIEHIQQSRE